MKRIAPKPMKISTFLFVFFISLSFSGFSQLDSLSAQVYLVANENSETGYSLQLHLEANDVMLIGAFTVVVYDQATDEIIAMRSFTSEDIVAQGLIQNGKIEAEVGEIIPTDIYRIITTVQNLQMAYLNPLVTSYPY